MVYFCRNAQTHSFHLATRVQKQKQFSFAKRSMFHIMKLRGYKWNFCIGFLLDCISERQRERERERGVNIANKAIFPNGYNQTNLFFFLWKDTQIYTNKKFHLLCQTKLKGENTWELCYTLLLSIRWKNNFTVQPFMHFTNNSMLK